MVKTGVLVIKVLSISSLRGIEFSQEEGRQACNQSLEIGESARHGLIPRSYKDYGPVSCDHRHCPFVG